MKNKKKYTIKLSGYHFKKICREVLNDNYKFNHLLKAVTNNEMEEYDYAPIYFPPESNYYNWDTSSKQRC